MSIKTIAQAIKTTLTSSVTGIVTVQIGAPASWPGQLSAYVTLGSQGLDTKVQGTMQRKPRFLVIFAYRVDDDETAAEEALMDAVDLFVAALLADRTLGGEVRNLEVNTGLADEPDYQLRAGKEYREYPVVVEATVYQSYEVNP